MRRRHRLFAATVVIGAIWSVSGCATTGSNKLTCSTTEVAPNSQPGSGDPDTALEWFLQNGDRGLPKSGFELTGESATRRVYANGRHQVSVGALPADKGAERTWVVMVTYECD